jgi:hypothetical protein
MTFNSLFIYSINSNKNYNNKSYNKLKIKFNKNYNSLIKINLMLKNSIRNYKSLQIYLKLKV